jgi:hypothetical protein
LSEWVKTLISRWLKRRKFVKFSKSDKRELITGNEKPLVGGRVGGKGGTNAKVAAIGAIALAFLRNRASAPRDMSAGAAKAFRGAIDMLMQGIY